ncbi:MAG: M23 family metallopeptidase [Patescibacteria group bacterium]
MMRWKVFIFGLFFLSSAVFVCAEGKPKLSLSTNVPLQGDVVRVTLENSGIKKATFKNKAISFFPYNGNLVAFIPISGAEAISSGVLRMTLSNGSLATRTIWVQPRKFVRVSLGIPSGSTLTTATLIDQLQKEKIILDAIVKKKTDAVYFGNAFQFPLSIKANIASPFGEIRKTGSSIIRHWGIDYVAPKGTNVSSISGGMVVKSYLDTTYGNTVIVDHGQGIFSMYMHLDERLKQEGESVVRGEVIGRVGNTGYSFGPHLHLSLKVDGISVDPQKFIELMK